MLFFVTTTTRRVANQGPVARCPISANHWFRGIKTYRFPWYLIVVSLNHASSNRARAQESHLPSVVTLTGVDGGGGEGGVADTCERCHRETLVSGRAGVSMSPWWTTAPICPTSVPNNYGSQLLLWISCLT